MWRQVVDEPRSYRETSVTGWLDESYQSLVERAWRALLAQVRDDGILADVCIGTVAGSRRWHYLYRPNCQRCCRPRRGHGSRRGAGVSPPLTSVSQKTITGYFTGC